MRRSIGVEKRCSCGKSFHTLNPHWELCGECGAKERSKIAEEKAEMAELMRSLDRRKKDLGAKW